VEGREETIVTVQQRDNGYMDSGVGLGMEGTE